MRRLVEVRTAGMDVVAYQDTLVWLESDTVERLRRDLAYAAKGP